jgi:hypothetical protein
MASHKLARRLAAVAATVLLPLAAAPSAHATDLGNYYLRNIWTKQCADLPGTGAVASGTAVWQDTCLYNGSSDNQAFGLLTTRTVDNLKLFEIVNVKSQLCLDLPGYGMDAGGSPVSLYKCNPDQADDNQEWYSVSFDGNTDDVLLINYASSANIYQNFTYDQCLDVSGWATDGTIDKNNRRPLTIAPCTGTGSQWGGSTYDGVPYDDHVWAFDPA